MKWVSLGILGLAAVAAAQEPAFEWNARGLELSERGEYVEAERLLEQASQRWLSLGVGFEAHLATTRLNQGQAVCSQGRRRECAKLLEESRIPVCDPANRPLAL